MRSIFFVVLLLCAYVCGQQQQQLLENWRVQNSAKVSATPQKISTAGFDESSWYPALVPQNGTVMAVLLQNNVYQNITYGTNLLNVNSAQFETPWWYRTEFPASSKSGLTSTITFKGINYKANVWINGAQIGNISTIVGTFRYFTFDITNYISTDTPNAIALEIYRPHNMEEDVKNVTGLDLAITFVDWAPPPPDANMGLWQEVVLTYSTPVTVDYPLVVTNSISASGDADLTVIAELANYGKGDVKGTLTVGIAQIGKTCTLPVTLSGGSVKQVFVGSNNCSVLLVKNALLWWPVQMGTPNLYKLNLVFTPATGANYTLTSSFGIRQVTSQIDSHGHRLYQINGKNILVRGAGWAPDLFQRTTVERQAIEMQYVLHMNLNTVRLEGKFENENLFDLADQYGILLMPGICCCDSWQQWSSWDATHYFIAQESVRSQVKRIRHHPSILVFVYSSDELPPVAVENLYLNVFKQEHWSNPLLASAAVDTSTITGPTGVKMSGPYSWVSPNYWLLDTSSVGGAFGFLTEGGPGESPLTWDSFVLTIPPASYWPIDSVWNFHCGAWYGTFNNLNHFTTPLNARYGTTTSATDYTEKSQVAAYEGQRAMFEGYSRNKYISTGVIQWMLNNAFTEMIWHLYDSYLVAGGGYYGSKKACEPVHIMYSYNDGSIWVVNSLYESVAATQAVATVYDIHSKALYNYTTQVAPLKADSANQIFVLPSSISGLTSTYFLRLSLYNGQQGRISENFYWLSTSADVPNFSKSTWYNTPCSKYADFTLLQTLPHVDLTSSFTTAVVGSNVVLTATVTNPSSSYISFFIRLRVVYKSNGNNILPIFWDDNYITLLPQEMRRVNVTFASSTLGKDQPALLLESFNNNR